MLLTSIVCNIGRYDTADTSTVWHGPIRYRHLSIPTLVVIFQSIWQRKFNEKGNQQGLEKNSKVVNEENLCKPISKGNYYCIQF